MTKLKLNATTHRPPNLAISILLTAFGIIQSASFLIENLTIRSIVIGIAQSMIFFANILKKNENTTNVEIPAVQPIEPFTPANNMINPIILDIPNDHIGPSDDQISTNNPGDNSEIGPIVSSENPTV